MQMVFVCAVLHVLRVAAVSQRSNVVFVLTDDQDATLASMNVMNATRALIGAQGVLIIFRGCFLGCSVINFDVNCLQSRMPTRQA